MLTNVKYIYNLLIASSAGLAVTGIYVIYIH